jgi:hypothetical protein
MGSWRYQTAADRGSVVFAIVATHTHPYQPMNPEITNPRLQTRLENLRSWMKLGWKSTLLEETPNEIRVAI